VTTLPNLADPFAAHVPGLPPYVEPNEIPDPPPEENN
jgi:hypothetical protein